MADQLRVLVVDDEVPLTSVVGSYLEREGFSVSVAHTGPDAVDRAREERPDLVVLDLMLPGFDGVEACRQMRTFTDAYIIMLTARDEEVDKVLALSMGADDYLVKPFSPRELIARVRAMLRRPRTSVEEPSEAIAVGGLLVVSSSTLCGERTGMATIMSSMSTSVICAPSSATTPANRDSCAPCEASATAWDRDESTSTARHPVDGRPDHRHHHRCGDAARDCVPRRPRPLP
jgi:CheY-like chemotaxis protein